MTRKTSTLALTALLGLTLLTGTGCDRTDRAAECTRAGNRVETDYSTKVEVKNGKRTVKTVKEYECIAPDGTELYEWK